MYLSSFCNDLIFSSSIAKQSPLNHPKEPFLITCLQQTVTFSSQVWASKADWEDWEVEAVVVTLATQERVCQHESMCSSERREPLKILFGMIVSLLRFLNFHRKHLYPLVRMPSAQALKPTKLFLTNLSRK